MFDISSTLISLFLSSASTTTQIHIHPSSDETRRNSTTATATTTTTVNANASRGSIGVGVYGRRSSTESTASSTSVESDAGDDANGYAGLMDYELDDWVDVQRRQTDQKRFETALANIGAAAQRSRALTVASSMTQTQLPQSTRMGGLGQQRMPAGLRVRTRDTFQL